MNSLALWADFASTGRLLGCDLECGPDAWDQALGDSDWPLVDVRKGRMRRDYGLVEVLFERMAADWTCVNASLLPHRLAGDHGEIVPPGVRNFYGPVKSDVQFSSVASEMDSRSVPCEEIADRDKSHYVRYWVERSEVIIVVQGAEASAPGAVWSIGKVNDAAVWRKPYM